MRVWRAASARGLIWLAVCAGLLLDHWLANPAHRLEASGPPGSSELCRPAAWAPDGSAFACVLSRFPADIWVIRPEARRASRVGTSRAQLFGLACAPDGRELAYAVSGGKGGARPQLVVANVETGEMSRLMAGYMPSYSPNGRYLAALSPHGEGSSLRVVFRPGGRWRTLTGTRGVWAYAWAPDSSAIAFAAFEPEKAMPPVQPYRLCTVSVERPRIEALPDLDVKVSTGAGLSWSANGRDVYFYAVNSAGNTGVERIDVSTRERVVVVPYDIPLDWYALPKMWRLACQKLFFLESSSAEHTARLHSLDLSVGTRAREQLPTDTLWAVPSPDCKWMARVDREGRLWLKNTDGRHLFVDPRKWKRGQREGSLDRMR